MENLAYLAGFIIGDGNLSKGYLIRAVEENRDFIEHFSDIFLGVFGRRPKIYFDKYNNSYVAYIHSKRIWNFLVRFGIPPGNKSRTVRIPEKIMRSEKHVLCSFLSGIFDAEGSVFLMMDSRHKSGYIRIQLKMHNNSLVKEIYEKLVFLGIKPRIYKYDDFSMIQINGRKECKKFHDMIGFGHPIKNGKISNYLTKNTWQGVYLSGEVKVSSQSESESPAVYQGSGYESARVTGVIPETCRSSPG